MNQRWRRLEAVYMGALTDSSDVSEFFVSATKRGGAAKEVNDELKTHKLGYGGFLSHGGTPKSSIKN